ncbi:MAG: hypothetical protein EOP10_03325 [Proteobacteria bacterium]|nr:MAG: hypothetical protein EOP10_03325 [Pseudomonadota bacterium]
MRHFFHTFPRSLLMSLSVFMSAFVLSACQSTPEELRILEKSRQVEPEWVKRGVGLRPSAEGIDYVILKDKVLDLPLGLTQAESSVLYNLKFHMFELILSHVDTSTLDDNSKRDLNTQLSKILDTELGKPNLRDFYFDKISVPEAENELIPEYYRIYALAHVEPKQRADITERIRSFIKSSPHAALRSQIDRVTRF